MTETATPAETPAAAPERIECMIHLRFNPDGLVSEIGERPAGASAHAWFKYLSQNTRDSHQALSGGRGLFRLPRPQVEALKAAYSVESTS